MNESDSKKSPPVTNDSYLAKMKMIGMTDEAIGIKLGMTPVEVKHRWDDLTAAAKAADERAVIPFGSIQELALLMVHQYQLMGQTMGLVNSHLHNHVTLTDLKEILVRCAPQLSESDRISLSMTLMKELILLKPFSFPDVRELLGQIQGIKSN